MSNLPKETIDKIKAGAKAYMHNEIKSMVGDEELQPHHLQYAHEAGATEWAGKAEDLANTLKWIQMHAPIEPVVDDAIAAAIGKYKELSK